MAKQTVKKDEDRTDLIAYSYDKDMAVSVEIESASEITSHPEAVRKNMVKWKEMGFSAYHGWSSSDKIKEIMESISQIDTDERKNMAVFVV